MDSIDWATNQKTKSNCGGKTNFGLVAGEVNVLDVSSFAESILNTDFDLLLLVTSLKTGSASTRGRDFFHS